MSTHKKNCEYHVIKKFEESLTENGQDIYIINWFKWRTEDVNSS